MKNTKTSSMAFTQVSSLLAVLLVVGTASAQVPVSPSQAAKAKGYALKGEARADLDGDGRKETFGVCEGTKGLFLCVFDNAEQGAKLKSVGPKIGGKIFKKVEAKDLVKTRAGDEVVVEVYDETPDEKVKRVRVYTVGKSIKDVFSSVVYRPKDKSRRPQWEQDEVIKYGDARQGWYFDDLDADGNQEILVRRKPRLVTVKNDAGPVKILMGVSEAVFTWSGGNGGRFTESSKRMNNFAPAAKIKSVSASSSFIPREKLKELNSVMIAAAADAAADGKTVPSTEIDRTPWTTTAADGDIGTGWSEDKKGSGKDEWVEVELEKAQDIHMVRIVPGCTASKADFRKHDTPTRVELIFDGGERALVNFAKPRTPDRPAVAAVMNPVAGKSFAKQALVFFDGSFSAKKLKVRIDAVKRRGRNKRACISEISVH